MNIPPPESNVSDTTAGKTRYYNMKMPVSSYHGGELHVQNRIQYEYPAPRIQCFGYYRRENAVT